MPVCGNKACMFQSTRPRGARHARPPGVHHPPSFNPRARVGRDGRSARGAQPALGFQSTRPRGARRRTGKRVLGDDGFNPRARVGRDADTQKRQAAVAVSIHAPAWGATFHPSRRAHPCRRFNPRARVGRDQRRGTCPVLRRSFNPRARVGRDRACAQSARFASKVSIHAPAWGATRTHRRATVHRGGFNPRARVGRDVIHVQRLDSVLVFQSTRPRGARRPAVAGDRLDGDVSIHAPAWGATPRRARDGRRANVSIHAPAWGATRQVWTRLNLDNKFQSTRPRGARRAKMFWRTSSAVFQSTRPRGARRYRPADTGRHSPVSIHAPAWGATSKRTWSSGFIKFQSTRPRGARPQLRAHQRTVRTCFNPRARVGRDD